MFLFFIFFILNIDYMDDIIYFIIIINVENFLKVFIQI